MSPPEESSEREAEYQPLGLGAPANETVPLHSVQSGATIGHYRLVERIGEGGMGEVWLAEQVAPVRRRVALKLIKAGMDTREVVARFESERQALALMDHPAIAKVFEAGSTVAGRPYFAMEFVPGLPITEFCDRHKLTMHERLQLFRMVCEGVQHAHLKAIIHRDLKPSNILVSEVNGQPVPKIIDFGVAKATAYRLTAKTLFTYSGDLIGTPEYMSPEQAQGGGDDIDTRTDIYSLGVVLYELLVGALPLDYKQLAFDEILRRLREEDAPKPSTRIRTLGGQSTVIARNRRTEARSLGRQLRGDLDSITLKALDKRRSRRYGSASDFSADIERYLQHKPVSAGPATVAYRASKYIRRHRLGVATVTSFVALLVAFAVTQAVQLRRITLERDRADRVTTFMTNMFRVSDPTELRNGARVTASDIIDQASREIGTALRSDPKLQAQMTQVIGTVYMNLGIYGSAESLLRRALQIRAKADGPEGRPTMSCMSSLTDVLFHSGRYAEALALGQRALQAQERVLGENDQDTLRTRRIVAKTLSYGMGRNAEAEKLYRSIINEGTQTGRPDETTIAALGELGDLLRNNGRLAEAEKLQMKALAAERAFLGELHPATIATMAQIGSLLQDQGRYAEAEKWERQTLDLSKQALGPEHQQTLDVMTRLGRTLYEEGRLPESAAMDLEALTSERKQTGLEHLHGTTAMGLAFVLIDQGHLPEAEQLEREALAESISGTGTDNPESAGDMAELGGLLDQEGKFGEAEKLERDSLRISQRILGPNHPFTLNNMDKLGTLLQHAGKLVEAEQVKRDMRTRSVASLGPDAPFSAYADYSLAGAEAALGRRSEAIDLLRASLDHGLPPRLALALDKDSDLASLRRAPEFSTLVIHARQRYAAKAH